MVKHMHTKSAPPTPRVMGFALSAQNPPTFGDKKYDERNKDMINASRGIK